MVSWLGQPLAMGCMRLSTSSERDPAQAIAVIVAGLDAGVRLLDTADVYCHDHRDIGHNERLVTEAIATWQGDDAEITVATKGGLSRPHGRWVPKGAAKDLKAACARSLRALNRSSIPLYQLHAADPRVPWKTSVRALAGLQSAGLVERVGLCNVTRAMLVEAADHVRIDAVQVAISPWDDEALYEGVVGWCEDRDIPVLAHSPLGSPKKKKALARHAKLCELAARHEVSPAAVILAWLRNLSPVVIPLPGPSRVETARAAAAAVPLSDDDRKTMDALFVGGRWARREITEPTTPKGEVVILMGIQGAGKSRRAAHFVDAGFERLNRDDRGGRSSSLNAALGRGLAQGRKRWVLDNTYPTRAARARVRHEAWQQNASVRCVWLDTALPDAQINAVRRLVDRYGHLPMPEELATAKKTDPHAFDPRAQFRFAAALAPPVADEGFASIERVPFERSPRGTHPAIMIQLEGVLRMSRRGDRAPLSADDVVVDESRATALRERGQRLLAISWQPAVAAGDVTLDHVHEVITHTRTIANLDIDIRYCPHAAGAPRCWCRTPLPGLAVALIDAHDVDPSRTTFVGKAAADRTLATRMGFRYVDHDTYFGAPFNRDA